MQVPRWPLTLTVSCLLVLLCVPLVGCSSEQESWEVVLEKVYTATNQVQSYRAVTNSSSAPAVLTEEHKSGALHVSLESQSEETYVYPDRLQRKSTIRTSYDPSGGNVWSDTNDWEIVHIDNKEYQRTAIDGEWSEWKVKETPFPAHFSPLERISGRFEPLVNIKKLSDEKVEGVNCLHYKAKVDKDKLCDQFLGKPEDIPEHARESVEEDRRKYEQGTIDVEFWIDAESYLLCQWRQEEYSPPSAFNLRGTETIVYYYNEPVETEPPM